MTRRLRVHVEQGTCISSAFCVASAPENFELDDNRRSHALQHEVDESDEVWDAAESCPVEAIVVEDAETGERLFPPED